MSIITTPEHVEEDSGRWWATVRPQFLGWRPGLSVCRALRVCAANGKERTYVVCSRTDWAHSIVWSFSMTSLSQTIGVYKIR